MLHFSHHNQQVLQDAVHPVWCGMFVTDVRKVSRRSRSTKTHFNLMVKPGNISALQVPFSGLQGAWGQQCSFALALFWSVVFRLLHFFLLRTPLNRATESVSTYTVWLFQFSLNIGHSPEERWERERITPRGTDAVGWLPTYRGACLMKVPWGCYKRLIKLEGIWTFSITASSVNEWIPQGLYIWVLTLLGCTGCLCKYHHSDPDCLSSAKIYEYWRMVLGFKRQ